MLARGQLCSGADKGERLGYRIYTYSCSFYCSHCLSRVSYTTFNLITGVFRKTRRFFAFFHRFFTRFRPDQTHTHTSRHTHAWSSRDNIHRFIISTRVSIRPCLIATILSLHATCTSVSTHSFDAVVQLPPSDAHSNKLPGTGAGVLSPNMVVGTGGVVSVLLIGPSFLVVRSV